MFFLLLYFQGTENTLGVYSWKSYFSWANPCQWLSYAWHGQIIKIKGMVHYLQYMCVMSVKTCTGGSNTHWSPTCIWYSWIFGSYNHIFNHKVILWILDIMVSCLPLSSTLSQLDVLSTAERQWQCCEACTVASLGIFSAVDWKPGPLHFIPRCALGEAAAPVFSGSCHTPSHQGGKVAVCVGGDRMTAL